MKISINYELTHAEYITLIDMLTYMPYKPKSLQITCNCGATTLTFESHDEAELEKAADKDFEFIKEHEKHHGSIECLNPPNPN